MARSIEQARTRIRFAWSSNAVPFDDKLAHCRYSFVRQIMTKTNSPFPTPAKSRSPFPDRSLPQPGESLQDAAYDLIFDKYLAYAAIAITVAAVAGIEWIARWLNFPITPWSWTTAALVIGGFATWRWFRIKPQLLQLKQGIRGERQVGQMLEELRTIGYAVFHDIPGDGFNIDHAIVGPGGVFAIETKTHSLPSGRGNIEYDGKNVLINGRTLDRDPVAQAEAVSRHLRDILKNVTARDVNVRPVVLFPGWWVAQKARDCHVWVLNPKALASFLENEPVRSPLTTSPCSPED